MSGSMGGELEKERATEPDQGGPSERAGPEPGAIYRSSPRQLPTRPPPYGPRRVRLINSPPTRTASGTTLHHSTGPSVSALTGPQWPAPGDREHGAFPTPSPGNRGSRMIATNALPSAHAPASSTLGSRHGRLRAGTPPWSQLRTWQCSSRQVEQRVLPVSSGPEASRREWAAPTAPPTRTACPSTRSSGD